MRYESPTAIVRQWQRESNEKNTDRLLELSSPDIEIVGPRGSTRGHEPLRDWLSRAGLTLETLRAFARNDTIVMSQRGTWKSHETGETSGEAGLATRFVVKNGRVKELARHDGSDALDTALEEAGLGYEDEVR